MRRKREYVVVEKGPTVAVPLSMIFRPGCTMSHVMMFAAAQTLGEAFTEDEVVRRVGELAEAEMLGGIR